MNVAKQGWMYDANAKILSIKVNEGSSNPIEIELINKK